LIANLFAIAEQEPFPIFEHFSETFMVPEIKELISSCISYAIPQLSQCVPDYCQLLFQNRPGGIRAQLLNRAGLRSQYPAHCPGKFRAGHGNTPFKRVTNVLKIS
jgi:hypothetical protein